MSVWGRASDLLNPPDTRYLEHPELWAEEKAGLELWSKQREVIRSVRDHYKTSVKSCHSAGKSLVAATTATWWIDVHPVGTAFVVTTAPTDSQVRAILWREINRIHTRAGLTGRTNLTEWYVGKELVAFGRKPADHNPDGFQGIHALYLLVIIDEGSGVAKEIFDAASTLASNRRAKILVIGNPDNPTGEFAASHRPDSNWNRITISYADTPNFTGEPVSETVRDLLVSREWVEDRRVHWGEHSALFTAKCKAEFPTDSEWGVIPYSWAIACRYLELPTDGRSEAGVDIGAGGDRTIVRERRGPRAGRERTFIDKDPMKTVAQIVECLRDWGVKRVKGDSNGIGWGICGRLKELSTVHDPRNRGRSGTHDAEVIPVNTAEASHNPDRFKNLRAEIHWMGRELSRLRQWDLSEVDDDAIHELTAAQYEIVDSSGCVKVEAKEKIIKRIGVSPDRSDALLLAYYDPHVDLIMPPRKAMEELAGRQLTAGLVPGSWS